MGTMDFGMDKVSLFYPKSVTDLTLSSGFYKILSCACFAVINLLLKTIPLPASEIACLENLLGTLGLWILPWILPMHSLSLAPSPLIPRASRGSDLAPGLKKPWTTSQDGWKNPWIWLRAVLALISSWLWVASVQKLPLLQTVAMGFLSPFVTLLGAWFFLGESLTYGRIGAIFLAFLSGTLMGLGGSTDIFGSTLCDPWVLAPLGTTVLFALVNLISKSLLSHKSPLALTRSLMGMTGLGLLSTCSQWVTPSPMDVGKLLVLSLLAVGAHIFSYLAMARSDMVALLPLGVLRLVITGLLGWFFLRETPSLFLLCGIILSIAASFCLSWRLK